MLPFRMTAIKQASNKPKITSVSEDVVKLESVCVVGGNVKWYGSCGKQ